MTVTLKLTEVGATPPVQYYLEFMGTLQDFKAMDLIHYPWGTPWWEIWPLQGLSYTLTNWIDQPFLSPSDQILLTLKDPVTHLPILGAEAWYHVDKLTVAMNLTSMVEPVTHIVKFEGSLQQFKKYHWMDPFGTQWHEVNPQYCRQWYLATWSDNGNGYLDYCDIIKMIDKETGLTEVFHVESLSTDMWVTQKIHDVAVTNITLSATEAYPTWIPPFYINVTVKNQGNFTETFTVTAYYDNNPIDTRTVINLPPGNEMLLQFQWIPYLPGYPSNPPAAWPYSVYVISANASILISGEINVTNNHFSDGTVKVKWPGDACGSMGGPSDGHVNLSDLSLLASYWFSVPSYDPRVDFDMSRGLPGPPGAGGGINLLDLSILATWWFGGPLD